MRFVRNFVYLASLLLLRLKPCNGFISPASPLIFKTAHSNVEITKISPTTILRSHHAVSGAAEHAAETTLNLPPFLDSFIHMPELWSLLVMLSLVGLLLTWEESVKTVRELLPETLMSVVDSMLGEMGGLGFIGLFLSVVVNSEVGGETIGKLSETFLGDEEILLENFEFLHQAFFQVGIGFFLLAGATVWKLVTKMDRLKKISILAMEAGEDESRCTLNQLVNDLDLKSAIPTYADGVKGDSLWDDIFVSTDALVAESIALRDRFVRQYRDVYTNFKVENYFEQVFAQELEHMVELSPKTWLPLIPFLVAGNSLDLSHGVISSASENAAASCGFFLTTAKFCVPIIALHIVSAFWCFATFYKMSTIKDMLLPQLVRNGDGTIALKPPLYENEKVRKSFTSSPAWLAPFERLFRESEGESGESTVACGHEELFGVAGAQFPEIYRDSIKFLTWLSVAQIVFEGGQILFRDSWAYLNLETVNVGNPESLVPELAVFGTCIFVSILQLLVIPNMFLNFCLITSTEELTRNWAIELAAQAPVSCMEIKKRIPELEISGAAKKI
mmetsp:Transcript_11970/g.18255  ORF Transcript_11970/g.18255 Transcript_11970/m.18255 type:complete len:560 (-) Transcript_11970:1710-3389(-)